MSVFLYLGIQAQAAGGAASVGASAETAAAGTCIPGVFTATAAREEAPALPLQQKPGAKQQAHLGPRGRKCCLYFKLFHIPVKLLSTGLFHRSPFF